MKLDKIGVRGYFEDIITAGNIGIAKPNVKIFEVACERNGVDVKDSYYIGDDIKSDILPCNEIGMKTILINRTKKEVDKEIVQVSSLEKIRGLV